MFVVIVIVPWFGSCSLFFILISMICSCSLLLNFFICYLYLLLLICYLIFDNGPMISSLFLRCSIVFILYSLLLCLLCVPCFCVLKLVSIVLGLALWSCFFYFGNLLLCSLFPCSLFLLLFFCIFIDFCVLPFVGCFCSWLCSLFFVLNS